MRLYVRIEFVGQQPQPQHVTTPNPPLSSQGLNPNKRLQRGSWDSEPKRCNLVAVISKQTDRSVALRHDPRGPIIHSSLSSQAERTYRKARQSFHNRGTTWRIFTKDPCGHMRQTVHGSSMRCITGKALGQVGDKSRGTCIVQLHGGSSRHWHQGTQLPKGTTRCITSRALRQEVKNPSFPNEGPTTLLQEKSH